MIPIQLKLSGFLSYRDPVDVDFTSFDLACISGHNGAGKSSLLDVMTWALFGQARKRDESVVNLQSASAKVEFTFAYETNTYRVIRVLPRGKTSLLEFQILDDGTWRPLTEHTNRETQARIEQVLRLDYDTFTNVSFFLQGRADQFATQPPARRKEILGSILGLETWETYRDRAAERRKSIEGKLAIVDGRVSEIDAELDEEEPRKQRLKDLEAQLKQVSGLRKTQETALDGLRKAAASQVAADKARLEEELRGLKEQEQVVRTQEKSLAELTTQIETAKKSLAEAEATLAERTDAEEARSAAREQFAELKAANESLKTEMDKLKLHIDQLEAAEGAVCPFCGQALTAEHRKSMLEQLRGEGKDMGDRFRTNKSRLEELSKQIADSQVQAAKFEGAERKRLAASNSVSQWTERVESIRGTVQAWDAGGAKRLAELEATLASEEYTRETRKPIANLEEMEHALFELQEQENRLNQEVGAARQKVNVLDDLRKRKKNYEAERGELGIQIGRYKTLERAFGKDGVPALLIEQALPEIEMKANEILGRLSDDTMHIHFETQAKYKDEKRKDLRETLEIQVSDGAGLRDYEMFSGGEAFRVNFAIRLALSEVLAGRKGARLQMLVIDEGFGSQDALGRQRLIQAINAVKADFAKILVITHLDELKDAFPTRIEVEKTENGSIVKVL